MRETYKYLMPYRFAIALTAAVGVVNHDHWQDERIGSCIIESAKWNPVELPGSEQWARAEVTVLLDYRDKFEIMQTMSFTEFFAALAEYEVPA